MEAFHPYTVHPSATTWLQAPFYWDREDADGPFSLNRVADCFGEFAGWRAENPDGPASGFLPPTTDNPWSFDRELTDTEDIAAFYEQCYQFHRSMQEQYKELFSQGPQIGDARMDEILEESGLHLSRMTLKEQDDMVIAAGFGQLLLEGGIDTDLKELTRKALVRQLNPLALETHPDPELRELRKTVFETMLKDLQQVAER